MFDHDGDYVWDALRLVGAYRVVYFAFGYEAINAAADRTRVMDKVLTWLEPPLVADFSAAPLSGTLPLTVTFTNFSTSTRAITSALWVYGDGVISSTLALTQTHTYTASGVYTVALTVEGPGGSDTLTRTNYITVSSGMAYTTTHRVISYTYPWTSPLDPSTCSGQALLGAGSGQATPSATISAWPPVTGQRVTSMTPPTVLS